MEQTDGYTEITGKNFEGWPPELIEESKRANANGLRDTALGGADVWGPNCFWNRT